MMDTVHSVLLLWCSMGGCGAMPRRPPTPFPRVVPPFSAVSVSMDAAARPGSSCTHVPGGDRTLGYGSRDGPSLPHVNAFCAGHRPQARGSDEELLSPSPPAARPRHASVSASA